MLGQVDPNLAPALDQAAILSAKAQVSQVSPHGQAELFRIWRATPGGADAFNEDCKSAAIPYLIGAGVAGGVLGAGICWLLKR